MGIKAAQVNLEEEQHMRDKAREGLIQAERNHHATANQLEEAKTQLEHADRQRRSAEQELSDLEEMLCETRIAEDKAKKAMIDAARLADELRAEQENAQHCEKNRRSLECQVKDMQTKLDEAEQQ